MKKIILLLLLLPHVLFAQDQITVQGTVKSVSLNESLPGATVLVKGTTRGVSTNIDGSYKIKANIGDVLVYSFIGMETVELEVTGPQMDVFLESEVEELEEVQVVSQGYFDVAKEDLTSSTSQITEEQISQVRANSLESIIEGQVAGVVVNDSSEPGGGIGISIRGTNSILGGTQPLYVVDGIPINPTEDAQGNNGAGQAQSSLNFINPNDIEKIEVMKDAAASALYGARGANGVVIITTKSGSSAEGKHEFGVIVDQTLDVTNRQLDVLTGPEFEQFMNQRSLNELYIDISDPNRAGIVYDGTQDLTEANFPELATFELPYPETTGVNTDWQDLTYRMAHSNAVNVYYRTAQQGMKLNLSLGLLNNEGVILNSDFNRITANFGGQINAGGRLKIYPKINFARSWGNAASTGNGEIFQQRGIVSQALRFQPIFDRLDPGEEDDVYASLNDGNVVSNPYTLAQFLVDNKQATNMLQSVSAVYRVAPGLHATLKGAYNYQRSTRDMYYPTNTTRGRRNNGEASQAALDRTKLYLEANVRYEKKLGKFHRIDAIAIGTIEDTRIRRLFTRAFGFGNDATSYYNFESATDVLVPNQVFNQFSLLSGLARVGYSYKRKYLLDVNARVDASSKFAANYRSAFFPSVSMGWIASKESFMANLDFVSFLKFRASYGQTGSNPIAPFQSLALMEAIRYNFDNTLVTGFNEINLANDDLTWETTEQYNFGIDFNTWEGRVRIVFDAYLKQTRNLLQLVNLPASNGYAQITDNFGQINNHGFELSVSADLVQAKKFTWASTVNFSRNRNELVSLNSNLEFQLGPNVGFAQANPIIFLEGAPLGIFWGAQTDGIYSTWEEANASGIENAAPGEIRYVNNNIDVDADGNPLETQLINFDDFVQIGDPNPDFVMAMTNNFGYGRWDLSILTTAQKGGDIFWVDSWQLYGLQGSRNVLQSTFAEAWRAPLTYEGGADGQIVYDPDFARFEAQNPAPRIETGSRVIPSDRQIFDGSFIRVKNINLGYNLPLKNGAGLRAYVSARNLFTITNYPGYDPEVETYNKNPQRRGVDFGSYPGVRSYVLGVNLNF